MRPDRCCARHLSNQGSVLVILLAFSAVVAVLGAGMITLGYQSRVRVTKTVQHMAARVAADAGLSKAIHTLTAQFYDGSLDPLTLPSETDVAIPNSQEEFTYTISLDGAARYVIVSTGTCRSAQASVEAVMAVAPVVHKHALLTQGDLTLGSSAVVDSYNDDGSGTPLQIATNSTSANAITLYRGAYVDGDVLVGSGGDPLEGIESRGGSYAGTAGTQSVNAAIPSVVVPDYLAAAASEGRITSDVTMTDSGKYDRINLGNSETLVIDGAVELYVTGDVTLGSGARIEIREGASLVLYVDGDIEYKTGSQIDNLTGDPRRFKIMGTDSCGAVELKNAGDMYAVIYAPQADVTLYNSATIWGSVTSKTAELKGRAVFHYDASLASYEDPLLSQLKLTGWREY
ncbi:MAG: hypothetical protein JSW27_10870 [Phycisphaerales bacterium]|nr:MAG: hypothetical protein JSW27_10870 [Phycisphaerales bacterium]